MRIAIVGSREFSNPEIIEAFIETLPIGDVIVTGGALGVDSMAEGFATKRGLEVKIWLPDWITYGKAAGPIRNEQIIQDSDMVVAYWNEISRGTRSSINLAIKYKKKLQVFDERGRDISSKYLPVLTLF
jgi:hypothetical protein